jgi:hypothetical protein
MLTWILPGALQSILHLRSHDHKDYTMSKTGSNWCCTPCYCYPWPQVSEKNCGLKIIIINLLYIKMNGQ